MPVRMSIVRAASKLDFEDEQIKYEILTYADRNILCHFPISKMVEECHRHILAKRVCKDLKHLSLVFQDHPQERIRMRSCIKKLEREFFVDCFEDNDGVIWVPTEKAERALRRCAARAKARLIRPATPPPLDPGSSTQGNQAVTAKTPARTRLKQPVNGFQ